MWVCGRVWRRCCWDPGRSLILLLLVQIPGLGKGKRERAGKDSGDWCLQRQIAVGKTWWNLQGVPGAVLGWFRQFWKLLGSSAEQVTLNCCVTCYMADTANPFSSFLFLAIFIHLTFVSLWVGQNQSVSFMWGSKRLEEWLLYPCSPCPGDRNSF